MRKQGGFALLVVLIGLAVVSLIVAAVVETARHYTDQASTDAEMLQLQTAVDAAVATAKRDLADAGIAPPQFLVHSQTFSIGNVRVTIAARPEASKIDINAADPSQLDALLLAYGFSSRSAARTSDEIADWHDTDSSRRDNGAEAEYLLAGRTYGPANRPFETISELALLPHGGTDLTACLQSDLTVFTGNAQVDEATASEHVRQALGAVVRNGPDARSWPRVRAIRAAAEAARRAMYSCAPCKLPADLYAQWHEINPFHFDPGAGR